MGVFSRPTDIPWYLCLPWFKSPHQEEEGVSFSFFFLSLFLYIHVLIFFFKIRLLKNPLHEIKDPKDDDEEPLLGGSILSLPFLSFSLFLSKPPSLSFPFLTLSLLLHTGDDQGDEDMIEMEDVAREPSGEVL